MIKNRGIVILNKDIDEYWLPLLQESSINKIGLHSLYQHGGVDAHINWLHSEKTKKLLNMFDKNGIMIEHELHAINWLLPRALFKTHPEWFRENDKGERTNDWNMCASNPAGLEYIENSALMLAKLLDQKSHKYYIWADDCEGSTCKCIHCRLLNGADQNMIIMTHILRGLKCFDQKAQLSFLSYQDSLEVPILKPDKDMFLEFAPIGRNHFQPMNGHDESNIRNRSILEKLLKIFPADTTQILEYFLDVSLFCKWKREDAGPLNLEYSRLLSDINYYKSLGIESITTFSGFVDKNWIDKYGSVDILAYGKALMSV